MTLDLNRDLHEILTGPKYGFDRIKGVAGIMRTHFNRAVFYGPRISTGHGVTIPAFTCTPLQLDQRALYATFSIHNGLLVSGPNPNLNLLTMTFREPGQPHAAAPQLDLWLTRGLSKAVLAPGWTPGHGTKDTPTTISPWQLQQPATAGVLFNLAALWMKHISDASATRPILPGRSLAP